MEHDNTEHHGELGHIQPFCYYTRTLCTLVVFTFITVAVSFFDFGNFNIFIAMLISCIKAMLVALFFMHLKYENSITWMFAALPIILVLLLIGGVFIDNPLRM